VGLAFLALHGALFWLERRPEPRGLHGDEKMYWRAAGRLLETGESGLEPLWPPGYVWLVAGGRALDREGRWPIELAQTLLLVATAWLVRDAARRIGLPRGAPDVAAAALLLFPTLAAFAHFLWPEVPHLFLLVLAAWILAARRRSVGWCLVLGAVLGAALLVKSLLAPFLPILLVPLLVEDGWRERVLRLAAVVLALGATVAPVALANWRELGRPMIANSARFNVWVGLNDRSPRNFEDEIVTEEYVAWRRSAPDFAARERILQGKIEGLLAERGWAAVLRAQLGRQYRRLLHRDSFLTDQLPGGAIHAAGGGYRRPPVWIARALRWGHTLVYGALLLAAPFGLAAAWAARRGWAWMGGAFLAYHAAIFLVLHVKTRYVVQLVPLLCVAAASAAVGWIGRRAGGGPAPLGPAGAVGAALAALLLLGLAFVGS
jgi:4-amino-4-deoxy-L-arabinose transferase-like glycosyltransferase